MKKNGGNDTSGMQAHKNIVSEFIKIIKSLFRFEEVEVTFDKRGKNYTYRVVSHKHFN